MLSSSQRRLVEHVAAQRGFELLTQADDSQVTVFSSLVPGTVAVTPIEQGLLVSLDLPTVMSALASEYGRAAGEGVVAINENELYAILGRVFQLCGSLPDHPLHQFEAETAELPSDTEAERLVLQRIGQDVFRRALEGYWEGRCAVTGVHDRELLRASHIRPWSECTDAERLDVYNGILLAAHLDAAFDKHLATFSESGELMLSARRLSPKAIRLLNPQGQSLVARLSERHQAYLALHRERYFALEAARS